MFEPFDAWYFSFPAYVRIPLGVGVAVLLVLALEWWHKPPGASA